MTSHNDIDNPVFGLPKRFGARQLLWVGLAVAASGCTTIYEGRYDFDEGWRKAEVLRFEAFEKLQKYQIPRCEAAAAPPPRATAGSTWAVVRYRSGRRSRMVAVPVASFGDFKVGELVYANVSDCSREIQKRNARS